MLQFHISLSLKMPTILKGCYTVKPAATTPKIRLPVSDCDQVNAITHTVTVYFYRPTSFSFPLAIQTLKNSLSQALVHFYPLAGRLHWSGSGGSRLALECNAVGALLYEAETDAKIDDFGDFRPTPELRALIPSVDYSSTSPIHELPLLLVQLTKLSCGGVSLGLALSHIIIDGASALHFIAEWARIARGEPLDMLPFLDRTLLLAGDPPTPPRFDHAEFSPPPLLIGQSDNTEERKKETTVTILHLSKNHVEKLKNTANDGRASGVRAYSRYEVVAGHLWRCACKARRHESEQITKVRVAVNIRDRMRPPLPQGYFGNAVLTPLTMSRAGELVSRPLGYASSRVREAVEMITDEYARSSLDFIRSQPDVTQFRTFNTAGCTRGAFFGNPNLEITSWVGLPVYGTDFGWGKEIYMGPGALGYEGKCIVLSGHDEDGSLVIALRLQVAHMEAFKMFFYEDII
uniref:Putative spermidine hydroxycinnamoyl transferase-like n=1 Tax=Davidia involucrata TaxID=16924 RepID=A0A5B7AUE2_DAVIN